VSNLILQSTYDLFFENFIAEFLILLFKQRTGTAGISGHLTTYKNPPSVLIRDFSIFDFAGMVGKPNSEPIQTFINVRYGLYIPILPLLHNLFVSFHRELLFSVIAFDDTTFFSRAGKTFVVYP